MTKSIVKGYPLQRATTKLLTSGNLGVSFSLVDCYFQNVLPLNRVQILNRFQHRIRRVEIFETRSHDTRFR